MDLEFVQFHPTGLRNGVLVTEGCRGEGAILVNADGERFMARYAPNKMELASRDVVSRAEAEELAAGRGVDGFILLDLRPIGPEKIRTRLLQVRELSMDIAGVDPCDEPIPVRPTPHYFMGGIKVDVDGRSPRLANFFAAGECSCVSVHGANRLGGNSLLDGLLFGRRAPRPTPPPRSRPPPCATCKARSAGFSSAPTASARRPCGASCRSSCCATSGSTAGAPSCRRPLPRSAC